MGATVAASAPRVPKLWPGATIACLATGPSLTREDAEYCRGRARIIAINDAYQLAPFADVLYASDAKWWLYHRPVFEGLKYSLQPEAAPCGVTVLEATGISGIETQPHGLKTMQNSGGAAINLAVHLGATRIVLLGYDMDYAVGSKKHFFGDHPFLLQGGPHLSMFVPHFDKTVAPLRALGIRVVNASRQTVLESFERLPLEEALAA